MGYVRVKATGFNITCGYPKKTDIHFVPDDSLDMRLDGVNFTYGIGSALLQNLGKSASPFGCRFREDYILLYSTILIVDSNSTGNMVNLSRPMRNSVSAIQILQCTQTLVLKRQSSIHKPAKSSLWIKLLRRRPRFGTNGNLLIDAVGSWHCRMPQLPFNLDYDSWDVSATFRRPMARSFHNSPREIFWAMDLNVNAVEVTRNGNSESARRPRAHDPQRHRGPASTSPAPPALLDTLTEAVTACPERVPSSTPRATPSSVHSSLPPSPPPSLSAAHAYAVVAANTALGCLGDDLGSTTSPTFLLRPRDVLEFLLDLQAFPAVLDSASYSDLLPSLKCPFANSQFGFTIFCCFTALCALAFPPPVSGTLACSLEALPFGSE
ncbi:hypothetical protein B0H13DRAFT_1915811 [Mycena leptocephala]|nr:hypothetical protein B0H13DRAFT_1915811 [Mycena leptocephala]